MIDKTKQRSTLKVNIKGEMSMTEISIGEKIARLRNDKNITQKELGKVLGISTDSVAMYELNESIPRDEVKKKIYHFFDVPVQEIFFEQ